MNSDNNVSNPEAEEPHRRAEDRLTLPSIEARSSLTKQERKKFHHELQVHRLELEMQNAELRQTRDDLETALTKCNNRLHDVMDDKKGESSK